MKKEIYLLILGLAGLAALMYVTHRETEPVKPDYPKDAMVIIPLYEDNEGRELYDVIYKDSLQEQMYAEEIAATLLYHRTVFNEDIRLCDSQECKGNQ